MSKELEALDRLYCAGRLDLDYVLNGKQNQDYKIVETALKEYEFMKQTKIIVSDKKISDDDLEKLKNQGIIVGNLEQSKVELLFDEETQKKLEALEIIKKKRVDVRYLFQCKSLRDYNYIYKGTNQSELCLTQEEYDLLKDMLK